MKGGKSEVEQERIMKSEYYQSTIYTFIKIFIKLFIMKSIITYK